MAAATTPKPSPIVTFLEKFNMLSPILTLLGLGGVYDAVHKAISDGWIPSDDLSVASQIEQYVARVLPADGKLAADALQVIEDAEPAIEKVIVDVKTFMADLKAEQAPAAPAAPAPAAGA